MTPELDKAEQAPREWLIRKDGYFYRPNNCGYTTSKDEAGRFTKAEADSEAAIEPWHMTVIHESEVPATKLDGAAAEITHLTASLAAKEAECEALRKKLTQCENMHLPEATSAAVLGHMRCMEAFQSVQERCLAAEAKLKRIRAETIEECAKIAEQRHWTWKQDIAAAIRAALASEDSAE